MSFDLTPAQKQRVLQTLAFYMMQKNEREVSFEEAVKVIERPLKRVQGPQHGDDLSSGAAFLKMIENSSGLLIEREVGVYSFAHLTFQEYLAAAHVLDQKLENELIKWVDNSWWHETIRLYAAQSDATNVIKACLARKRPLCARPDLGHGMFRRGPRSAARNALHLQAHCRQCGSSQSRRPPNGRRGLFDAQIAPICTD